MDLEALKKNLLKKFQEEGADRLQKIQLGILDLEKPNAKQASEMVARELHTMKGEARLLGLAAVGQLVHAAEDVLKAFHDGKVTLKAAADLLLRACDGVSDLLEAIDEARTGTEASTNLCRTLSEASGRPVPAGAPGTRGEAARPTAAPHKEATGTEGASIAGHDKPQADGSPALQREVKPPPQSQGDPTWSPKLGALERSIRVNVEVLDGMGTVAGDLLVESARAQLQAEEMGGLMARFSRLGERFVRFAEGTEIGATYRKALEVLENDLNMLRDDTFRFSRRHTDGLNTLHGNLAQLADQVAKARLVPLSSVFEAFPRAVRELAQLQAKEVELAVDNNDVGVDRTMLADVRDALIHLIRNAVDHGLETPEARQMIGKPSKGKLTIRVRVDGEMLVIQVSDDGKGIDPAKLRESAVAKGIVGKAQVAQLSDREALELIFMSGFSTRTEVTDISGRGVGLEVVKRKVEALGGSVAVSTRIGQGTTFNLRLPQSLALMKVLLIRLGDDVYGVPASEVEAVTRVKPEDRLEILGTLAVMHRGKPTSLVALGPLLALNGGPRFDKPPAVVVQHGEERAALVVDGFVDEREVAVKPCGGEFLKAAPFVAGTAALEDGRIAVLLHVPDVMAEVRRISRPVAQSEPVKRLRVLLVDDSPIARATESALVRALGHSVEEAQDGEEGFQKATSQTFDLILTDVQMPRVDGFELTRKLKAHAKLGSLPVIILSSLASPEDKRRGLDVGADAYLIKGELGVEVLAQAIDRLT